MTVSPDLSVIIPVGDLNSSLSNLNSIFNTYSSRRIEFIVVIDDQSPDVSKIFSSFSENFGRSSIKNISGDFGSPGLARNIGLGMASATWICFLDSDDFIDLHLALELAEYGSLGSADIVVAGIEILDLRTSISKFHFLNMALSLEQNLGLMPAFTRILYRRSFIKDLRFSEFKMAEDQCFLLDVIAKSPTALMSEKYFYLYKIGQNDQATIRQESLSEIPLAIQQIRHDYKNSNGDLRQVYQLMVIRLIFTFFKTRPSQYLIDYLRIIGYILWDSTTRPKSTFYCFYIFFRHRTSLS